MLAFEYLLPENGKAGGHWIRREQTVIIQAKGLKPSVICDVIWIPDHKTPVLILTGTTDESGALDCRFQTKGQEEGHVLISAHNRCLMRSPGISSEKCRELLWMLRKQKHKEEQCMEQSAEYSVPDHAEDVMQIQEKAQQKEDTLSMPSSTEPPVVHLPERDWKHHMLKPYFESCAYESVSMPADVTPWRFIRTRASAASGNGRYECYLGVLFQNQSLCADAIIIPEQAIGPGNMLPGFQYQKAPDGGGFWIKTAEY